MTKPRQKTLNGKNAAAFEQLIEKLDKVLQELFYVRENIDVIRTQTTVAAERLAPREPVETGLPPDFSDLAKEWLVPRGSGYAMKHYTHDRQLWLTLNEEMTGKGFKWISDKKNSRWE